MRKYNQVLLLFALTTSVAGCTSTAEQIKTSGDLGQVDKDYIDTEYRLAQLDDQEAELAKTKAADPRVVATATSIKSQADTLHPRLQTVLGVAGIAPPDTPRVSAEIAKLRDLNGPAFDQQYVADQVSWHERAVDVLKREEADTKVPALRTQVQAELPVVQDNLKRFQVLAGEVGQSSKQ